MEFLWSKEELDAFQLPRIRDHTQQYYYCCRWSITTGRNYSETIGLSSIRLSSIVQVYSLLVLMYYACTWYPSGIKHKNRLDINVNTKRSIYLRSVWHMYGCTERDKKTTPNWAFALHLRTAAASHRKMQPAKLGDSPDDGVCEAVVCARHQS